MDTNRAAEAEDLYETDYFSWTQRQAAHLRSGQLAQVDLENVAEEIESLDKSQLAALTSAYRLIAMHLLKQLVQPEKATTSWVSTISRERGNVELLLDDNPGLKPKRAERFARLTPSHDATRLSKPACRRSDSRRSRRSTSTPPNNAIFGRRRRGGFSIRAIGRRQDISPRMP